MFVSVRSWLLFACRIALASIAGTVNKLFLLSPQGARASPGRIHSLQVPAQHTQSLEPILSPKLQLSILPTSLTYIVLSTRGCSPRRAAAVMSTNRRENQYFLQIFKGLQECTSNHKKCGALRTIKPYLLEIRFHGVRSLTRKENSSQGSCWRLLK